MGEGGVGCTGFRRSHAPFHPVFPPRQAQLKLEFCAASTILPGPQALPHVTVGSREPRNHVGQCEPQESWPLERGARGPPGARPCAPQQSSRGLPA